MKWSCAGMKALEDNAIRNNDRVRKLLARQKHWR